MPYQDLYNQMATAAPAPNPYAQALRTQPMAIPRPPRPQQQNSGGNNMASIASKIAKKYFGGDPTTTSGAGGSAAQASAIPAQAAPIEGVSLGSGSLSGSGIAAGGPGAPGFIGPGASVGGGASGGISGASVTGGSSGAGLGGGSAGLSGAGLLAAQGGVLAAPFVARELFGGGNPNIAQALRDFKIGKADQGPRGLEMTEAGGVTFIKGDEGEVDRAWRQAMEQGIKGNLIRPGVLSLDARSDDVKPVLASNSPGMDNSLFGYLSNG